MIYTVMLVDDNELITRPISKMLHALGYEVLVAHSGKEAFRKLQKKIPKVVLLDIGMPNMDGYMIAQQIKKDPRTSEIILVAFSGQKSYAHKHKARKVGFHHQISKPATIEDIVRILNIYDF